MLMLFAVLFPICLAAAVPFLPPEEQNGFIGANQLALVGTSLPGLLGLFFWFRLPRGSASYLQGFWYRINFIWIPEPVQARFALGADALGLSFFLLSALLLSLTVLFSLREKLRCSRLFYVVLLVMATALYGLFMARDLLLFYFFWELLLAPAYLLIGLRVETSDSLVARRFLAFALVGSLLLLLGVTLICFSVTPVAVGRTIGFPKLYMLEAGTTLNSWIFLTLLGAFGIITAVFPLHAWQLEVWEKAPTAGSVFLTGLFVNTGIYGLVRVLLPVAYSRVQNWGWWLSLVVAVQIIYGALVAWRQTEYKKLVAYAGLSQIGFGLLGIFSLKAGGVVGGLFQALSHGLIIAGLFFIIRIVSRRSEVDGLDLFAGLAAESPVLTVLLAVFLFTSFGLAGTVGFFGKLVVIANLFSTPWLAVIAVAGFFLAIFYVTKFLHRAVFSRSDTVGVAARSIDKLELGVLLPLILLIFGLGFYPGLLFRPLRPVVQKILNRSGEVQKVPKSIPSQVGFKKSHLDNLVSPGDISVSPAVHQFSFQAKEEGRMP